MPFCKFGDELLFFLMQNAVYYQRLEHTDTESAVFLSIALIISVLLRIYDRKILELIYVTD